MLTVKLYSLASVNVVINLDRMYRIEKYPDLYGMYEYGSANIRPILIIEYFKSRVMTFFNG